MNETGRIWLELVLNRLKIKECKSENWTILQFEQNFYQSKT